MVVPPRGRSTAGAAGRAGPGPGRAGPGRRRAVQPVAADRLRELLEAISVSATYRSWLAQGDVIERWAVVTDNLAEGVSPRARLRFLAPSTGFTIARRGDRQVIAAASYARYDLFADVVGSVDVAAATRAYRELHGLLEAAYRALGYPEGSLDRVTAAALKRLAAAPARDGEVFVEAGGTGPGHHLHLLGPRAGAARPGREAPAADGAAQHADHPGQGAPAGAGAGLRARRREVNGA